MNDNGCTALHFCALISDTVVQAEVETALQAGSKEHSTMMSTEALSLQGVSCMWRGSKRYDELVGVGAGRAATVARMASASEISIY